MTKKGGSKKKGKKAMPVSVMGGGLLSAYELAMTDLWGQTLLHRAIGAVTGDKAQLSALQKAKLLPVVIANTKPLQYGVLIQLGRKVPGVKKLVRAGDGVVRDVLGKGWKA